MYVTENDLLHRVGSVSLPYQEFEATAGKVPRMKAAAANYPYFGGACGHRTPKTLISMKVRRGKSARHLFFRGGGQY